MTARLALLTVWISAALLSGCDLQQNIAQRSDIGGSSPSLAPQVSAPLLSAVVGTPATFDLTAQRGHPVVIDFFGSWCGPCRIEQPDLNALAQRYKSRGVVFIGVAMRDQSASVQAYLGDLKVPYPSVVDSDESIASAYNVASPPTTVVIDSQGHVVDRLLGTTVGLSDDLDRMLPFNPIWLSMLSSSSLNLSVLILSFHFSSSSIFNILRSI